MTLKLLACLLAVIAVLASVGTLDRARAQQTPPAAMTLNLGGARSVWVQDAAGGFHPYIIGAPGFVNASFAGRWISEGPSVTLPPATPGGLRLTKIDIPLAPDDIWVAWNAVAGATWYEIYHSGGGEFDFESRVTTAGYLDQYPNVVLDDSYIVRACNAAGCSDFSTSATEVSDSLLASLRDTLAGLFGLDPHEACAQLLLGAVDILVVQYLPVLEPVSEAVGSLIADELGCQ